jgi:hypothetical protein
MLAARPLTLAALLLALPLAHAADDRGRCAVHGDPSACEPYGCIPAEGPDVNRDRVLAGAEGFCGPCKEDSDCGGAMCRTADGVCARYDAAPVPRRIWPRFSLGVADVSANLADEGGTKPIVSVGYLFQGALRKATPVVRPEGGWITPDLPSWYANAGVSAAFAGPTQNLFVDVGVTYYHPGLPLGATTASVGLLVQRFGGSVWDVSDSTENTDRLGPAATVGFLQNVYLRGAYVFPLRGAVDHGALILSLVYMRDLAGDLVPDRFRKHLPEALR